MESNATLTINIQPTVTGTIGKDILSRGEIPPLDIGQIKQAQDKLLKEGYTNLAKSHKKFVDMASDAILEVIPPWD